MKKYEELQVCPICGAKPWLYEDVDDIWVYCTDGCPAPRCEHFDPQHTALSWNDWVRWYLGTVGKEKKLLEGFIQDAKAEIQTLNAENNEAAKTVEVLLNRLVEMGKHCEKLQDENERLEELMADGSLQTTYDAVLKLQERLREKLSYHDARKLSNAHFVKALAATYELQDYLANEIAGELDPDLEG